MFGAKFTFAIALALYVNVLCTVTEARLTAAANPAKKRKKQVEVFVPPDKPDYNVLENIASSVISEKPEFIQACKEMAGYYKDPTKNPALKNTIMMGGINYSYRDFYHNFKCYTDRLGIKFLPISLDEEIYSYITSNKYAPSFTMPDLPGREKVKSEASGFGGKNFNLIGCRKIEAVFGSLKLGYDVVFSDVDIALMRDPAQYLFFEGVDYVHSDNTGCNGKWKFNDTMEGNTGFYSIKSNSRTIRTFDLAFRSCSRAPLYDDQTMFWLILRTNTNPPPEPLVKCPTPGDSYTPQNSNAIVSCPLENCMFSASNLRDYNTFATLTAALRNRNKPAIMAHANWMNGKEKKKAALVRTGLWITQKNGGVGAGAVSAVAGAVGGGAHEVAGNWTCKPLTSSLMTIGVGAGGAGVGASKGKKGK